MKKIFLLVIFCLAVASGMTNSAKAWYVDNSQLCQWTHIASAYCSTSAGCSSGDAWDPTLNGGQGGWIMNGSSTIWPCGNSCGACGTGCIYNYMKSGYEGYCSGDNRVSCRSWTNSPSGYFHDKDFLMSASCTGSELIYCSNQNPPPLYYTGTCHYQTCTAWSTSCTNHSKACTSTQWNQVAGTSCSDDIDGEWCNSAPVATISTPENGAELTCGAEITFYGTGTDADGDALAYRWRIDGVRVDGQTVKKSDLTTGSHTAQFWVNDGSTNSTVVTVNFTVGNCPVCGNGEVEGAEPCDLGDAAHGDGNGECPKTCSTACSLNVGCCTALEIVSSSVEPEDIPVNSNYTITCDYGEAIEGIISVSTGSGVCTGPVFDGTKAVFSCVAGSEAGDFDVSCLLAQAAPSNKCTRTNPVDGGMHVVLPADRSTAIDCSVEEGTIYAGQSFTATIKMGNSGASYDNTWDEDSYVLKTESTNWGKSSVALTNDVTPGYPESGHQYSFTETFTAPASGIYSDFAWQMFNGTEYFGSLNDLCGSELVIKKPSFSLSADSSLVVEIPDEQTGNSNSNKTRIRITADPGFTDVVTLTVSGSTPSVAGLTSGFVPNNLVQSNQYSAGKQVYVTIPNDTAPGFRKVSITGTADGVTKEVLVDLEVINPGYINR